MGKFLDSPARGVGGTFSGRLADQIYAHGPHGPYVYTFSPRIDPNTWRQVRARAAFTNGRRWRRLIPEKRLAWDIYAKNTPITNRVGSTHCLSGFNAFVASVAFRRNVRWTIDVNAPTVFTKGRLSPPTYTPFSFLYLVVNFDLGDPWRHSSNAGIVFQVSVPYSDNRHYFSGPFRILNEIKGSPSVPPVAMVLVLADVPTSAKPVIFVRSRVIEADNRLSPPNVQRVFFPF